MEWLKAHPYATAGIVFGVGLLILIVFVGGSSPQASTDNGAAALAAAQAQEAASGNQLQQLQAELQASQNQTAAGVSANGTNDASAITIAQIAAQQATNQSQIAADSAKETAMYNAQSSEVASTATVQINANNDTTAAIMDLFDRLAVTSQIGATGGSISGAFDPNTGKFSASVAPTQTLNGFQPFITDPSGAVYGVELANYPGEAFPGGNLGLPGNGLTQGGAGSLPAGTIYAGNNIYYAPIAGLNPPKAAA